MLTIDNNTSMEAHAVHRDWDPGLRSRSPVDGRTFSDIIAECKEAKRPSDGVPISYTSSKLTICILLS